MKESGVVFEEGICDLGNYVLSYESGVHAFPQKCGRYVSSRTYTLKVDEGEAMTKLVFVSLKARGCDRTCKNPDKESVYCDRKWVMAHQESKGWIGMIIDSSEMGPYSLPTFEDFLSLYGISPPTTGDIMPHMESDIELTPTNLPQDLTVDDKIELARDEEEIRDALSSIESLHFGIHPYVQTFYNILKKHDVDVK